jgi:hypothetical protein
VEFVIDRDGLTSTRCKVYSKVEDEGNNLINLLKHVRRRK